MPAIEKICIQQGWLAPNHPPQIDHLYLSLGPGSFTGLRIAVALARTLAQAINCKIVAVPSLDVIAQNAPQQHHTIIPILDAKRSQVFAAKYTRSAEAGDLACELPPALVEPTAFLTDALAQSPDHTLAILGEGIDHHRQAIDAAKQHGTITELPKNLWHPSAATVHQLAWLKAQREEFADPATLLPIYIRLPEAEEVWRKKNSQ
jgi:tRNA threonylcarbamoyladenosine biosynthesis protein TsaB